MENLNGLSISNKYGAFIGMAMGIAGSIKAGQDKWKDRLRKEWQETKTMPRKMKKRRRKEIMLDWSFASYDPFGLDRFFDE